MSIITTIDPTYNFWELYPDLKVINPFKEIYVSDKSKSHINSSIMMWFVVLCYSKISKFRNLPIDGEDGKHLIIGEDYCNDKNYYSKNIRVIDELIEAYINLEYSPLERHLLTWEELLHKRTKFIKSQDYDLDTYEDLDKMATGTDKVYKTIKNLQDEINKEDASGIGKGGAVSSLND